MKYGLGDTVEDLVLPNDQGTNRSLHDTLEENRVTLVFFRGFW